MGKKIQELDYSKEERIKRYNVKQRSRCFEEYEEDDDDIEKKLSKKSKRVRKPRGYEDAWF